MGDLSLFLKSNKKEKGTMTFAATKSLCDAEGEPLLWTIRAVSTTENQRIKESCTFEVPVTGKPGLFRPKTDIQAYLVKLACAATVEPNLYDKSLQDSYGVMLPEELIKEMIDSPAEFDDYLIAVQKHCGFDVSLGDKVETAKN